MNLKVHVRDNVQEKKKVLVQVLSYQEAVVEKSEFKEVSSTLGVWVRLERPKKYTAKSLLKPWSQTQPSSFTTRSDLTDDFDTFSTSASEDCIRGCLLTRTSPFK